MTTFITKETINRLLKDVKQIIKNPLTENGIYYIHDDTDMMKGYALIIGPSDTPYFGGNYFFVFEFPNDYPYSPPKVKYHTNGEDIRFNPNLYKCGKVCISLLNTWSGEQWTSCQTISTILLTLCTLLCKDPLLNEPGIKKEHYDLNNYNEIIMYSNLNVAICDIISKKKGVYQDFFKIFETFIKDNFLKNYEKYLEFSKKKLEEFGNKTKNIRTGIYGMNVCVDYDNLIKRLEECKFILS